MFISDIHGSLSCLSEALLRYEAEKPDKMVLLGDILYHGPRNPIPEGYDPKGVISRLNALKESIIAVRGNCDAEVDQMVLDFPMMSDYQQVLLENRSFYLSHGHLYDNELPKGLGNNTVYVQGHTHIPMIERKQTAIHMNPGSVTLPKNGEPRTYGVYENDTLTIKTMDGEIYLKTELSK